MPVQVDSKQPGLWLNTAWNPKQPGTFATIIGVSKYDHLTGDDDKSYGLGQLYVSALTAYRFFCWLKADYRHPDLPLAKVWLLLSPTDAELTHMGDLPKTGFIQPTFANCESAIGEWFATMEGLDSLVCEKSRAIFFFSGHGLEVTPDKQILLPSDYLSPPNPNVNKALSTYNLHYGLQALPMPEHFLFLDACRNDNVKLRELSLEGWPVLNPCPSWRSYPKIISSPIVYATGSGETACEPMDPQRGISIFGQALVEGLEDVPGQAMNIGQRYWVTFLELGQYLRGRVDKLIEATGARVRQHVRIEGTALQAQICEVDKPPPVHDFINVAPQAPISALSPVPLPPGWPGVAGSESKSQLWNIFQNEFLTALLADARVYDLSERKWNALWTDLTNPTDERPLTIRQVARTDDKRTYQIDVEMNRTSTQWLELTDNRKKKKAACVLIGDKHYHPRYTLRFDFLNTPGGAVISGLDASLAGSNWGMVGRAASVWSKYPGTNIDEAVPAEFALLSEALSEKEESPLAATVAALLLLRARRPALLHNWPRNLAKWFPDRPDGCVVWAEQLFQTEKDKKLSEAIIWLLELERRGLPHTAEALGLASRQVKDLIDFAFPALDVQQRFKRFSERAGRALTALRPDEQQRSDSLLERLGRLVTALRPDERKRLKRLRERLERALAVFRPGGFCAVFIGPMDKVTPDLILPA